MMIALLLAQAVAPASVAPPPDEDIVVIARKLDAWRGVIRTNPFGTKCVTKQSTGDRDIDAIGCTAMERCWPDTLPRLRAAHAKGVVTADRERLEVEIQRDFDACAKPQRAALLEGLQTRRMAARGQGS